MGKAILVVICVLLASVAYYYTLEDPVSRLNTHHKFRIYRDENGIPRIIGKDKSSSFYAVGYAEASDRLWTLFIRKMMLQGRLAEIFGEEALTLDLQMRNYNFEGVGKTNEKSIDEKSKVLLQSYCNGINDYVKSLNFLPFQFYLTGATWEEWNTVDIFTDIAFFSFVLEFDWMYEIARQRLLETVGFKLAMKMIPFGSDNLFRETTIMSDDELKEQGRYSEYNKSELLEILQKNWVNKTMSLGSIYMPSIEYETLGSNAWVIGGDHTENKLPLLANDPHLGLIIPSLFYMLELSILKQNSTELEHQIFGIMVDGVPGISIGRNKHFAWGSTASYVDNKDIFHEKVRDNNGTLEYFFNDKWRQFEVRKEVFKIRGKQNLIKDYYHTHRGPVVEHLFMDLHFKYGYPIPNQYRINHTISISSAIYFQDSISIQGYIGLGFAQTFQEFEGMSSLLQSPNIDSVWISKNGSFGYGAVGRTPRRKIPEMGSFIKDGTTDEYDMQQFLPFDRLPKLKDPKKGYVCMANNKFASDNFDERSSLHELTTGRSYRLEKIITDKIKKNEKFNFQDMKRMQLDDRDEFLAETFPSLLKSLANLRQIWSTEKTERYFSLLEKWDYHMPIESVETSIYHVFEHQFQQSLLHGTSLSEQERQAIINHAFFEIYLFNLYELIGQGKLTEDEASICSNSDNANYTAIHPCLANVALSFKKLPELLEKLFGTSDQAQYKWGKVHQHTYKSIPWSDVPVLKHIWGRQTPASGNSRTLDVGILTHQTKSFNSIAGPLFRFITDLNRTVFSFDTGESDRVYSKYYDNFLGTDKYVEYVPRNPLIEEIPEWRIQIDRL